MSAKRVITHAPHLAPKIAEQVAPPPVRVPASPTLITKFQRVGRSLKLWNAAGRPLAPRVLRKERAAICKACPYWHAAGNAGFGECRAPGCGCTGLKRWLLTEKCPQGKWPT